MSSIVLMLLLPTEQPTLLKTLPPVALQTSVTLTEPRRLIVDICESRWNAYFVSIFSWFAFNLPAYIILGQILGYFSQERLPPSLQYPKLLGITVGLFSDFLYRSNWKHLISTLIYHKEAVEKQLQNSYGDKASPNLLIVSSCFNPFAPNPNIVSMSVLGMIRPYWQLLEKATQGILFFVGAGNDGVPMTTHLRLRNHGTGQVRGSRIIPFISEKFNLWHYREEEFQAHSNVIHCGVCTQDGLQLVGYSNFPTKNNELRFLAVALPEGCPSGTSMAAPIITGIFCKLKTTYPERTNDEIIDLMFRTARYVQYGKSTHLLDLYHRKIEWLTSNELNSCRKSFIQTIVDELSLIPLPDTKSSPYGSVCQHYQLLQRLLDGENVDSIVLQHRYNWGNFYKREGTSFYTVNLPELFEKASRDWGPNQQPKSGDQRRILEMLKQSSWLSTQLQLQDSCLHNVGYLDPIRAKHVQWMTAREVKSCIAEPDVSEHDAEFAIFKQQRDRRGGATPPQTTHSTASPADES